jgi:hypothetical protein
MKLILSSLLILLILASGYSYPATMCKNSGTSGSCMVKHQSGSCTMKRKACKQDGGDQSKKHNTGGPFCEYCILCIAFIVPVNPVALRSFVAIAVNYPDLAQSKLTDYNPSCWRPPNALIINTKATCELTV